MNIRFFPAFTLTEMSTENGNDRTHDRVNRCKTLRVAYKPSVGKYVILVRCTESYSSKKGHLVSVLFDKPVKTTQSDKIDCRVWCSCPAWQYWGSAYTSTALDYNLEGEEKRFPKIRDPNLINTVCKHVLTVREKTLRTMSTTKMKNRYEKKKNSLIDKDTDIYNKLHFTGKHFPRKASAREIVSFEEMAIQEVIRESESVPIEDTFEAIAEYMKRNKFSKEHIDVFLKSLTEANYEDELEKIGVIING